VHFYDYILFQKVLYYILLAVVMMKGYRHFQIPGFYGIFLTDATLSLWNKCMDLPTAAFVSNG